MKILKVTANNFKLCEDNFTISFVPEANKTVEDKEFELNEIDENLFVFKTLCFIGKNASGKTTASELLSLVYDIFSMFRIRESYSILRYWDKMVNLDITFYNEGYLYRYVTDLCKNNENNTIVFKNQKHIYINILHYKK